MKKYDIYCYQLLLYDLNICKIHIPRNYSMKIKSTSHSLQLYKYKESFTHRTSCFFKICIKMLDLRLKSMKWSFGKTTENDLTNVNFQFPIIICH